MASGKKTSKSNASSTDRSGIKGASFVVCVKTGGYVDLEPLKVYKVRRDVRAAAEGLLRVVDASGEEYLYPESFFRRIEAPAGLFKLVEAAEIEARK